MKILILSDTHGNLTEAEIAVERLQPDQLIHLGDVEEDADRLREEYPNLPVASVPGNNDWFSPDEKEKTLLFGGVRIFLCHGHTCGVRSGPDGAAFKADRNGCRFVLYGHTHVPLLETVGGVTVLNPGACYAGTVGWMEIGETSVRCSLLQQNGALGFRTIKELTL